MAFRSSAAWMTPMPAPTGARARRHLRHQLPHQSARWRAGPGLGSVARHRLSPCRRWKATHHRRAASPAITAIPTFLADGCDLSQARYGHAGRSPSAPSPITPVGTASSWAGASGPASRLMATIMACMGMPVSARPRAGTPACAGRPNWARCWRVWPMTVMAIIWRATPPSPGLRPRPMCRSSLRNMETHAVTGSVSSLIWGDTFVAGSLWRLYRRPLCQRRRPLWRRAPLPAGAGRGYRAGRAPFQCLDCMQGETGRRDQSRAHLHPGL